MKVTGENQSTDSQTKGGPIVIAYADPPYPGQAKKHYGKEPTYGGEVDHVTLVDHLNHAGYGGWALSTSSTGLPYVVDCLNRAEITGWRIGAWVKPFASFKPGVNPAYAWEPVIFWGGRRRGRELPTLRDWHSENITLRRGLAGAKPPGFCRWVFDFLGARPDDKLVDLYPGTGAVGKAWEQFHGQAVLA